MLICALGETRGDVRGDVRADVREEPAEYMSSTGEGGGRGRVRVRGDVFGECANGVVVEMAVEPEGRLRRLLLLGDMALPSATNASCTALAKYFEEFREAEGDVPEARVATVLRDDVEDAVLRVRGRAPGDRPAPEDVEAVAGGVLPIGTIDVLCCLCLDDCECVRRCSLRGELHHS